MNVLTLHDYKSFLHFLLRIRRPEIDDIPVAREYASSTLDPTLADLEALPPEHFGGAPNAQLLFDVDGVHDGHGQALHYLALAYQASPVASPDAKLAAQLILDEIVPSKRHLMASYATEGSRAQALKNALETHRPLLERLPVEGGTAFDWASAHADAGIEIASLLIDRADSTGQRGGAVALRSRAASEVRVFRELIGKTYARSPEVARRLDKRFFGYLDVLTRMRASGSTEPTPPPPSDENAGESDAGTGV
jgi:hypothetical protein